MVDSPETNSLIYWSDGGDSFFGACRRLTLFSSYAYVG